MKTFLIRLVFNSSIRKKIWARIATQLKYNVPLLIVFKNLREQYKKNAALYELFDDVCTEYESAKNLAKSLGKYAPYDEIMLIESCESNGKLHEGFELAERIIIAKKNIKSAVKAAVAYPGFLFLLLTAILLTASLVLIPAFKEISDPENWQGMGYVLYVVSEFLNSVYGILSGIGLVLFIVLLCYSFPNYTGAYRVKLDKIPPYSVYRMVVGSTWLFTFSSLMKAGKQQVDILKSMANSEICTPYLQTRMQTILEHFRDGNKFGDALVLAQTGFPDEELINDLKVYSDLPGFEEKLYKISEDWITQGEEKLKENAKVFQNACLILITIIIIGIILAYQEISMSFGG